MPAAFRFVCLFTLLLFTVARAAPGDVCYVWSPDLQTWVQGNCLGSECSPRANAGQPYPYVVLVYKAGNLDSWNDFKTKAAAEKYKKFWSKFDNKTWPKFCGCQPSDQYRYTGPFPKCPDLDIGLPRAHGAAKSLRPLIDAWNQLAQAALKKADALARNQTTAARQYLAKLREAYQKFADLRDALQKTGIESPDEAFERTDQAVKDLQRLANRYESARSNLARRGVTGLPPAPPRSVYPRVPLRFVGTWNGTFTANGQNGTTTIIIDEKGKVTFTVKYTASASGHTDTFTENFSGIMSVAPDNRTYVCEVSGSGQGSSPESFFTDSMTIRGTIGVGSMRMRGDFMFSYQVIDEGIEEVRGTFDVGQ